MTSYIWMIEIRNTPAEPWVPADFHYTRELARQVVRQWRRDDLRNNFPAQYRIRKYVPQS